MLHNPRGMKCDNIFGNRRNEGIVWNKKEEKPFESQPYGDVFFHTGKMNQNVKAISCIILRNLLPWLRWRCCRRDEFHIYSRELTRKKEKKKTTEEKTHECGSFGGDFLLQVKTNQRWIKMWNSSCVRVLLNKLFTCYYYCLIKSWLPTSGLITKPKYFVKPLVSFSPRLLAWCQMVSPAACLKCRSHA